MSHVILQPAGNAGAREHYADTIQTPVEISRIAQYVSPELVADLNELYPSGQIPTWGVVPGVSLGNKKKWHRIQTGDVCVFSKDGHIFATGTVTLKAHSAELAVDLWGKDPNQNTWEYIYFLDEVQNHRIPYSEFNKAVGYKSNFVIQGFSILDEEKSAAFMDTFGLSSEIYYPDTTESEFVELVDTISELSTLDQQGKGTARREQGFLRKHLFGNRKVEQCAICGKEYPVSFLVAAHIKKRARCTLEEQKDYRHIVMPMCKFGCDELYERGYIGVRNGRVVSIKPVNSAEIKFYVGALEGRSCNHWNDGSQPYFNWHIEKHA